MSQASLREYHRQYRRKNLEKVRSYHRKWKAANPEKIRAYARKHYKANPLKLRDKGLRRKFGITLTQYESLREQQGNKCAICRCTKPGGRGDWHADHDHKTGKVRGLLCQNCNIGLGNFKDSPRLLSAAITYLH